MIIFHVVSGPMALLVDIIDLFFNNCISLGGILKLFKILTVPGIKGAILGIIKLVPLIMIPFIGIISLIFALSIWSLSEISHV